MHISPNGLLKPGALKFSHVRLFKQPFWPSWPNVWCSRCNRLASLDFHDHLSFIFANSKTWRATLQSVYCECCESWKDWWQQRWRRVLKQKNQGKHPRMQCFGWYIYIFFEILGWIWIISHDDPKFHNWLLLWNIRHYTSWNSNQFFTFLGWKTTATPALLVALQQQLRVRVGPPLSHWWLKQGSLYLRINSSLFTQTMSQLRYTLDLDQKFPISDSLRPIMQPLH